MNLRISPNAALVRSVNGVESLRNEWSIRP